MYRRRRRPSSTAVLPTTRRASAVESHSLFDDGNTASLVDGRQATVTSRTRHHTRSIGTAYISSSSSQSSSRSSSPTIGPVRHPVRQRPVTRSRTRDRTAFATSARYSGPIGSGKTAFQTRRPTLLRSPVFQFLLSPGSNAAVPSSTSAENTGQNTSQLRPTALVDSVQILHTEPSVAPQRNLRGRTRSSRSTRRRTALSSTRVPCSPPPQSQPSENNCVGLTLTDEVRAALTAAAEREGNGLVTNADDDCVICLCAKSNRSVVLPCMHTFCFSCIHRWLSINPSCPLCKRLTQRIIHSILSDTRFTEVLVSDLQRTSSQRYHSNLEATGGNLIDYITLDREMQSHTGPSGSQRHQQQHHHYHYHLGNASASSLPFIDYLVSQNLGSSRSPRDHISVGSSDNSGEIQPLIIPSILVPPESGSSSTSLTGLLEGSRPLAYPWYTGVSSSTSESRRCLVIRLVNNSIRARDSLLLDSLLLRQLVYVLEVDSVPVNDGPTLERNISPSFLTANETHRHRLEQFIRRELRAMAPWLAYPCGTEESDSRLTQAYEESTLSFDDVTPINAAITSPLIRGAPGFLADTQELDALTRLIVQHFTTVSMTNQGALVNLLTTQPMLHPSLVPTRYLWHFASEVLQFARYSGSISEYDSAVCLYRRRMHSSASNSRTSDPRLAVYVASACLPRLRPGFSQPIGLLTYPLIYWLMQRLFAHCLPGRSRLTPPGALTERDELQSPTLCHPNCLMLATLTRTLLTSLPSSSRTVDSVQRLNVSSRRVGSAELWPSRLLYQRVLSELIDHARFSEAIGIQYSYSHRIPTHFTPLSASLLGSEALSSNTNPSSFGSSSTLSGNGENGTSSLPNVQPLTSDSVRPIIQAHSFAIRRLRGLLFLFTDHISVLDDLNDITQEDGYLGELLNTPLLPVPERRMQTSRQPGNSATGRTDSTFIDLTTSSHSADNSQRHTTTADHLDYSASVDCSANAASRSATTNFSGSDWNFLRRLPAFSSDSSEFISARTVRSRQHLGVPTFQLIRNYDQDATEPREPTTDSLDGHTSDHLAPTGSGDWEQRSQNGSDTIASLSSNDSVIEEGQARYGKRMCLTTYNSRLGSTLPCVVISSDSSSDERECEVPLTGVATSSSTAINNRAHFRPSDSNGLNVSSYPDVGRSASPSTYQIASSNPGGSTQNGIHLMEQSGGLSQLLSNIEEKSSEAVAKLYISNTATSPLEEALVDQSFNIEEPMDVSETGHAVSNMFPQHIIACRQSLMSDALRCAQKKNGFGSHSIHRQLHSCFRLQQHRSGTRSISSDSDSEFEFLRESITLRSSSSSRSVSSTSSYYSTNSATTQHSSKSGKRKLVSYRSRSPALRSSEVLRYPIYCTSKHCRCGHDNSSKKRYRHHRRRKHHTMRRSCCHYSKHHRHSGRRHHCHHHHCDRRRPGCTHSSLYDGLRVNCRCTNSDTPTIIPVNSASSPILISDNDERPNSLEKINGRADGATDEHGWSPTLTSSMEKTSELPTDTTYVFPSTFHGNTEYLKMTDSLPTTCQPSCSYSNGKLSSFEVPCSVEGQKVEEDDSVLRQAAGVSTSSNVKVDSIYEPVGVGDFYHFMDRLTTSAGITDQDITSQTKESNITKTATFSPHKDDGNMKNVSSPLSTEEAFGL